MIFGVTGGRNLRVSKHGFYTLEFLAKKYQCDLLISGHCPTEHNVDLDCEVWAKNKGIKVATFPAKFYNKGVLDRSAGPKRNKLMADFLQVHAGILIAFKGGSGTMNMVEECVKNVVPIVDLFGDQYVENI